MWINSFILITQFGYIARAQVSQRVSELVTTHCAGYNTTPTFDSFDADVSRAFVGSENILEEVRRELERVFIFIVGASGRFVHGYSQLP